MKVYQVIDWNEHFENHKSRQFDNCSFVCVPNKQDGMGLTRVLSEPDGAAIYGIFNLIIGACSRQPRPREGWLTDDGRAHGRPWTVGDLSLRWRRRLDEVQRAVEFLASSNVAWLRELEQDAIEVPAKCPSRTLEQNRTEQNRTERPAKAQVGGVATADAATTPADPVLLVFPCMKGKRDGQNQWPLLASFVKELSETFPAVDVAAECKLARGWVSVNDSRRKTFGGMRRFLFDWMKRENDRPRGHRNGDSNGHHRKPVADRDREVAERARAELEAELRMHQ